MRIPDQVRWDFVQQWLDKAQRDWQAAAILFEHAVDDYDNVGFHAHQVAEKFLKAMRVRYQVAFPKTHSIAVLRHLVAQVNPLLATHLLPVEALTPYGVECHSPGDLVPLPRDQGSQALCLAEQARVLMLTCLQSYLGGGRPDDTAPTQAT